MPYTKLNYKGLCKKMIINTNEKANTKAIIKKNEKANIKAIIKKELNQIT